MQCEDVGRVIKTILKRVIKRKLLTLKFMVADIFSLLIKMTFSQNLLTII